MNLIKWGRLRELDDLLTDYRDAIARIGPLGPDVTSSQLSWRPVTDIVETSDEYIVKAQLPEVERDDVSVTVEDGTLTISGKREWKKDADDEKQRVTESFYGSFSRSFNLPDNVDQQHIRAESKNGMLIVHLPKTSKVASESRVIEVD